MALRKSMMAQLFRNGTEKDKRGLHVGCPSLGILVILDREIVRECLEAALEH
jgi:hypothetical protein